VISLNLVLAGLRLGLKNRQVGEKWVADDCNDLRHKKKFKFFYITLKSCCIPNKSIEAFVPIVASLVLNIGLLEEDIRSCFRRPD
jgi:hypothetical protein